jgi:hypothetical protein
LVFSDLLGLFDSLESVLLFGIKFLHLLILLLNLGDVLFELREANRVVFLIDIRNVKIDFLFPLVDLLQMLLDFRPILLQIGFLLLLFLINLTDPLLVVHFVTLENLLSPFLFLLGTHSDIHLSFHECFSKNVFMMDDFFVKFLQSFGLLQSSQFFLVLNHLLQMFTPLSA